MGKLVREITLNKNTKIYELAFNLDVPPWSGFKLLVTTVTTPQWSFVPLEIAKKTSYDFSALDEFITA